METRPIIQIPLEEYERMVSESEKLRKRVEYLENIRAEYIKKELGLIGTESVWNDRISPSQSLKHQ